MRFIIAILAVLVFGAPVTQCVLAQSPLNPDISVIPRFRIETDDGEGLPGKREFHRPRFTLDELELGLQAYLNPFVRADIFLSKPGEEDEPLEIEEAYATVVRGLPLGLNLKVGKYLVEFGKLNVVHPHAWAFTSRPLVHQRFLGEEGLNDLGVSASILIPTGDDVYTRLAVDLLAGNSIGLIERGPGNRWGGPGLSGRDEGESGYAQSGRLMSFFPIGDYSDLEIGLSALTGIHDPENEKRFWYANVDFKYKWKPSSYTSLVLQGEALWNSRTVVDAAGPVGTGVTRSVSSSGFYLYGDYQFLKIFSVGGRLDWAQAPYGTADRAKGFALFIGYYPVEETTGIRLQYLHTRSESPGSDALSVNTITLQLVFSMGPHRAHVF